MSKHRLIVAAMALLFSLPAPGAEPPVVVELYTSQGCNSCPPADKIVAELSGRADVLPLSFHVDYWDYIGWKDTFATPANTERQRTYQRALSGRYVYTPQVVIGGGTEAVGSDRSAIERAIKEAKRSSVAIAHDGGVLRVGAGAGGPATIWMARFDPRREVDVARGENSGKRLAYTNVVREWKRLGAWTGAALELPLEVKPGETCAVILQKDGPGPVLGVYRFDRPG